MSALQSLATSGLIVGLFVAIVSLAFGIDRKAAQPAESGVDGLDVLLWEQELDEHRHYYVNDGGTWVCVTCPTKETTR